MRNVTPALSSIAFVCFAASSGCGPAPAATATPCSVPAAPSDSAASPASSDSAVSASADVAAAPPVNTAPSMDESANTCSATASPAPSASAATDSAEALALAAAATGPATGGPRGTRNCEFRESVDSYRRSCVISKNPDGSLQVTAKGTELNPNNGFAFSMHGGPNNFTAKGELQAFNLCSGPFTAQVVTVIDKGVTTYELRFRQHCMIVIR